MNIDSKLHKQVEQHSYPLVFATISGAHLYGFPSPDSDYDLRGVHLLPLEEVVGLDVGRETVEASGMKDGIEIDLVTHDAKKFFNLVLKKNGYVLEQIFSPLVITRRQNTGNSSRSQLHASPGTTHIIISDSQRHSGSCFRRKARHESSRCCTCTESC